jgi:hypothetical protein
MPCSSLRQGMITVMLFDLYMPEGLRQNPSYHVGMKLLLFAVLSCTAAFASENLPLKQVQFVYILPMGSGMDQYLANKITRQALFQVVTDPQKADTIFTDRIGEPFERKLDELYPPPKPPKPEKPKKEGKEGDEKDAAAKTDEPESSKMMISTESVPQPSSSFGRGKGTYFLVDRKSRAVIWSTYDRTSNNQSDTMDKKAEQIITRLRHDLKDPPKETK